MMNAKTITTIALLGFVAVSIAAIGFKNLQKSDSPAIEAAEAGGDSFTGIAAYYFHRTQRCETCLKMEDYAKTVVTGDFASWIDNGDLQWSSVNIDLPENQHFIEDFQLYANSLVLARLEKGKPAAFKNLDQIWEKSTDEGEFTDYIKNELTVFAEST